MSEANVSQETQQTPEQERQSAEAAFAIASTDTPVKAVPEVVDIKAEKEEPQKEVIDPWKDVPAVVRETLEGINGKLGKFDTLGNDMKAGIGRIAAMQSELAAAKAAAKNIDNAPTQDQIAAAAVSPEKWDKLKELFKDWSDEFNATDAIDERINGRIAAERAEVLKLIPDVPSIDIEEIKKDVREISRVDSKFPTWEEDICAPDGGFVPEFAAWKNAQPPEIQALGASSAAKDAIKMLGLYYDHRDAIAKQEKKRQQLEAAIPAKGTPGQRQPTQSEREAAEKAFASA